MPGMVRNERLSKAFLTEHSKILDDDDDNDMILRTTFKQSALQ